ncbi:hypothetical protein MRX96_011838 [Rhipicephalus microplus]
MCARAGNVALHLTAGTVGRILHRRRCGKTAFKAARSSEPRTDPAQRPSWLSVRGSSDRVAQRSGGRNRHRLTHSREGHEAVRRLEDAEAPLYEACIYSILVVPGDDAASEPRKTLIMCIPAAARAWGLFRYDASCILRAASALLAHDSGRHTFVLESP